MAATVEINWDEAKLLFSKGFTLKSLAEKFGVTYEAIRRRSSREKWSHTIGRVRELELHELQIDVKAEAAKWQSRTTRAACALMEKLEAELSKALKLNDTEQAARTLKLINEVQRSNLDMDDNASSKVVVTQVTLSLSRCDVAPVTLIESQVVDVQRISDATDATQ